MLEPITMESKERMTIDRHWRNPDGDLGDGPFWKVMVFNDLRRVCGYFNPNKTECELQGFCLTCSCPLASPLNPSDEPDDRIYFAEVFEDDWEKYSDGVWMVVWKNPCDEKSIKSIKSYGDVVTGVRLKLMNNPKRGENNA